MTDSQNDDAVARLQAEKQILLELAAAGATEEGVRILSAVLPNRIKGGVVLQKDGKTPMAGTGDAGSATIADLAAECVKAYPSLFRGNGRGGGGASSRHPPGNPGKVIERADFDRLPPAERTARIRAGWTVVD